MMHISDIDSLTNFKRDTAKFMRRMARTKRPMALTVNGKAKLWVMDGSTFDAFEDYLEFQSTQQAIQRGLDDVKAGRTRPAADVFKDVFAKLNKHNN